MHYQIRVDKKNVFVSNSKQKNLGSINVTLTHRKETKKKHEYNVTQSKEYNTKKRNRK